MGFYHVCYHTKKFLSYFCTIRDPIVDFQYKRDEEPKDTSKYTFMSIYQYIGKYESHDKYTLLEQYKEKCDN